MILLPLNPVWLGLQLQATLPSYKTRVFLYWQEKKKKKMSHLKIALC
jgi:hypothetical protein